MKKFWSLFAANVLCEEVFDLSRAQFCGSSQRKSGKFGRKKFQEEDIFNFMDSNEITKIPNLDLKLQYRTTSPTVNQKLTSDYKTKFRLGMLLFVPILLSHRRNINK